MRIAFVISSLGSGGAERVAVNLCNEWQAAGHDISIVSFETPGTPSFYPVAKAITILQLDLFKNANNLGRSLVDNISRILQLRRTFAALKPDLAVAFMTETGVLCRAALLGSKLPLVISERIDPHAHPLSTLWQRLRKWAYPSAAAIVVQTGLIQKRIAAATGVDARIIPNPVRLADYSIREEGSSPRRKPFQFTAIGRLERQKGFDVALHAFAALNSTDVELNLYGEGSERAALEGIVRQHALETRVHFHGRTQDVPQILAHTDVFIHPARYEGYPNVVIEALAAGCCVVASDDTGGGTRELLGDNRDGLLIPVNDVQALCAAMNTVITDDSLRVSYRRSARQAVSHLDSPIVARAWLDLFEELIAEP